MHFTIQKMAKTLFLKLLIKVPRLSSGIGIIILKRLRNSLEWKIFMRRCVIFQDLLDIYEEVCNVPGPPISTIHKANEKVWERGGLNAYTIKYFMSKGTKFARFFLLPKIHKRLHDVPGRPVISNCGYYTENIFSCSDLHLQPLAQEVKP